MKLLSLALLLLPAMLPATPVLYSLDIGDRTLVSFVTENWLTDRPFTVDGTERNRTWELIPAQMINSPCDESIGDVFCSVRIIDFNNLDIGIQAIQRYADGETNNLLTGLPLFPIHLDQLGSSQMGAARFSIALTDLAPTVSPEPSTLMLLLLGIVASWFWRARRARSAHNQS